jgi:flavodoxin
MKTLLILFSYHHKNTQKIADVFAKILEAQIKTPPETNAEDLQQYDLIGFGSGIYFGKHHKSLLEFAEKLPPTNKKAFIFSTNGGNIGKMNVENFHKPLKTILTAKGFNIVGEFNCAGFDTFGPLKLVGGISKGRPNEEDLKKAESFAANLIK